MSLAAPRLLWLALLVPMLVVAYALDGQRRRRVLDRIGHLPTIAQMIASLSPGRRRLQSVLSVLAIASIVVALSRPQASGRARLTESRGLDLVVALDLSRSMLARDVYPSRLERAKAEVGRLLDELKGDRVGLVAFAGETMSYPLTTDYEAAKLFWRDLQPSDMPLGGTDLGGAIKAASDLLANARAPEGKRKPAQVIILITDGEDTESRGLDAARAAAGKGVHIYAIAIGSKDRPFVPLTDDDGKTAGYVSGSDGEPVRVGVDEDGLKKIAAVTGGEYFAVEPRRFGVERVQQAIAALERTEEEARLEREPEDVGRWFVLAAFVLASLGAAIGDRRRRVEKPAPAAEAPSKPTPAGGSRGALSAGPAVLLVFLFPLLGGFDLFMRKDPDLEAGNKALGEGHAEEALKAYDRAAATRPEDPTVRFDRGAALLQLNRLPEAARELQRAAETHDSSLKADAYYNLGLAQHKQEHFREAVDAYKHALSLRPDDRRTKWNLEVAQRRLREQKEKPQDQKQNQDPKQDDPKQDQKSADQKQNQDPKQEQKQQEQKQADQKQQDPKQDQKSADQKQQEQKQQEQKQQEQKQQEQKQQEQKQADEKQDPKQDQKSADGKQQEAKPDQKPGSDPNAHAAEASRDKRAEIERQDAEAVLDALERVEPTVQKDLARKRAAGRKAKKDW